MRSRPSLLVLLGSAAVLASCTDQRVTSPSLDAGDGARLATAPCTDCIALSGSLAGKNSGQYQPGSEGYQATSGAHRGWLRGPAGADYVLELERFDGSRWRAVAKADAGKSASESLTYNGAAGTYRWRVSSRGGGGAYELWIQYPGAVTGVQVGSIGVTPASATLQAGTSLVLSATAYDTNGNAIPNAPIGFASGNTSVARVDAAGVVTAVAAGSATITASLNGVTKAVPITVLASGGGGGGGGGLWASLSTGQNHSCGVTSTGAGYCWGANMVGELGNGTIGDRRVPTLVAGGVAWSHIDGGDDFTCGVATSGDAYCWGYGWHGQLGDGVLGGDRVLSPTKVVGGVKFARLDAGNTGNYHACGVSTSGAAYCWGNNSYGQLGNGQITNPYGSASPVAVLGGLAFTEVAVGRDFTCGITTSAALYCWGDNEVGQLGDGAGGPSVLTPRPSAVAGGRTWKAVATGDSHACGVTTAGEVYCWGEDLFGELGQGAAGAHSNVPVRVSAGATFQSVGVGTYHTCAVSTAGEMWCWGYNEFGTLGRGVKGATNANPTPQPVLGGIAFAGQVQGGYLHTCARAADGGAYCWGFDGSGELGNEPDSEFCFVPGGQAGCRSTPWPVAAPGGSTRSLESALTPRFSITGSPTERAFRHLPTRRTRLR